MTRFNSAYNSGLWRSPACCAAALIALAVALGCQAADRWPPAPLLKPVADVNTGPLPPSVEARLTGPSRWRCTFSATPRFAVRTLALAGSFNGWNRAVTPLTGPDENGSWSALIELPAGVHVYKFVANGDVWFQDPRNDDHEDDGHSGRNSVLRLGRVASLTESDARIGDGRVEALALRHEPDTPLYFQRAGAHQALVRLRTLSHDVERIWVVVEDGPRTELNILEAGPLFTLWETIARLPDPAAGPELRYTFVLSDAALRVSGPDTYGVPVSQQDVFHTPDWAKHAVWYQIFPDRFRNGDPSNDPENTIPWTMDWFASAPHEGRSGDSFYKHFIFWRHYGGDIAGIQEKLPYLKDLGVNAIYLNPVFKAWSNHKYDATNFLHIDDQFGVKGDYDAVAAGEDLLDPSTWKWTESDRVFLRFLKQAHALGFKVIIDGVFNHVGRPHPAFQDLLTSGKKSRYADWFNVTSWDPFEYSGWGGYGELPEFKKNESGLASETLKQHIFNVTRRWMDPDGDGDPSDGIDGWRLDVPNEIPAPFWAEWRAVVKSVNPEAYITGEIWDRADQWLDGRHFDAVMNYEFARAAVGWVFDRKHKITPSDVDRRFRELRLAYPLEATLVLQNLMDSHDTDRIASMAHNPDRAYDHANRVQDNGPKYDNAKPTPRHYAQARLTALLQMTYVGAPMIFYGDEVGMWGADDPTCRKPMLWKDLEPYDNPAENAVMEDQLAFYKRIIALRNAHAALRTGSFQTLLTDDEADVWAFLRKDHDEQLVVALNASSQERTLNVPLPPSAPNKWQAVFNTEGVFDVHEHNIRLRIPPLSGVVLHAATPK